MKAQTKWSWLIAAYLFLAGVGGGAYITGAVADFLGSDWAGVSTIGVLLGFPCVLVGCMFLIADLGKPVNFWRAAMRPNTSWIARGTIIITVFMILGAVHTGLKIWSPVQSAGAVDSHRTVAAFGILFALGTVVYTGILLGASRPIAFWSTATLPLLFLVSALSTGTMAVILVATVAGEPIELISALARADAVLIVLEILVLGFYLQATHRVPESRASARLVLTGSVAPLFWAGVVVFGLFVPLAMEVLSAAALEGGGAVAATAVASVTGIIGGLFLRQVVLAGGIHAPLRVGRFEYALSNT
ncbi:MAG: NrfD/PsrC family molybdoenzyme membrane anchor subunit [Acidobacteriota bacterium]